MSIYENVKREAEKKKMTLQELEVKSGIGSGCISRWKTVSPNMATLEKVAETLGTTVIKLIK